MASQTLPVFTGDKDRSLQEVLQPADGLTGALGPRTRTRSSRRRTGCRPSRSTRIRPRRSSTCSPAGTSSRSRRPRRARRSATTRRSSNAILKDPSTRALYLFPTKALAQDQLAELHALSQLVTRATPTLEIGVFTYDGDTPPDARRAIRGKAHVVLSNPDMLHSGILPHHPRWAKLFENLRFVVIDELHAYRGVFGSHLANILRRLQRVCRHYGSRSVFICSSATIANPRELAEGLTGRPFELVEKSGAPRGEKFFSVRQSAGRQRASSASAGRICRGAPRRARVPASTTCS